MGDIKEKDLPKITTRSDIKEVRLVKTDGTSTSMEISTFIKEIALEIARSENFASVVAGLILNGQPLATYTYPSDVDNIQTFSVAMVNEVWEDNPLTNYGKYGLLFTIGVPFEGSLNKMCIQLVVASVNGTSQVLIRTLWNRTWQSWKLL